MSTKLQATADGLATRVEKGKIISTINQSSETVSISASKINFNGLVTANNYFKILTDGSMQASYGIIGGATILSDGLYLGGYLTGDRGMVYKCGMSSSDKKHAFWAGEDKWYVNYDGSMHAEKVDLSGKFQSIKDDARISIYDGKTFISEKVEVVDLDTGKTGYEWMNKIYIGINSKNNPSINVYGDVGELCVSLNKKGVNGKVATYGGDDYKYAIGSSAANIWRTKVIRTITSKDNFKKLIVYGGYGKEGSSDTNAERDEESHYFLDQSAVLALINDACNTLKDNLQSQINALKK